MFEHESEDGFPLDRLDRAITEWGLESFLMGLEGICGERVASDPAHAAYWAVMQYRLAEIAFPPSLVFDNLPRPCGQGRRLRKG